MKDTQLIMGMPITVEIVDTTASKRDLEDIFSYFISIDEQFSPFKKTSELSQMNAGHLTSSQYSPEMREILKAAEETRKITNGFFNVQRHDGSFDTSGIVKGWAIAHAAKLLQKAGFKNYFVDAGGDIQVAGKNAKGDRWLVGIADPFDKAGKRIVKVLYLGHHEGIATSGTYVRGQHIYNPLDKGNKHITDIVSLTVIGQNVYDADRFATGAFAMGKNGISFIENLPGFEGYMIDKDGIGTYTSGFEKYLEK